MSPVCSLIYANAAFMAVHFVLSHPLRRGLVTVMGETVFLGLYSLLSLGTFAWIVMAFRQTGADGRMLWDGSGDLLWALSSVLTLIAIALLIGSLRGNPALPQTSREAVVAAQPVGAFAVTRHPMMWGFAIWAAAHILVMPNARTTLTAFAMGWLALAGAHLQDRKKRALIGRAWRDWEARTSFAPRLSGLAALGAVNWLAAIALWLVATWLHIWLAGITAGPWRWLIG
jgi:uncharacterized membrane protein